MKRELGLGLALLGAAAAARAGRYEELTAEAAKGPKATVVAATFFGGEGAEEFVAAAEDPQGGILAFGNAWGPQEPAPGATELGRGAHSGAASAKKDRRGEERLDPASPDRTGFVVRYAPGLARVEGVVRFGWGVAAIEDAVLPGNGAAIVAGRTGPNGASIGAGRTEALVARLEGARIAWARTLPGCPAPATRLWLDDRGRIYFRVRAASREMWRIDADGSDLRKVAECGSGNPVSDFLGVHPRTGDVYYGGDRNTSTGQEPWRQPFLYVFAADGQKRETLWEWPSGKLREKGYPAYGMVSDSSARQVAVHPSNGDLVVGGWSDGGNSVFLRQPRDIAAGTGNPATGFSAWGMKGANSLAYLMRIDPGTWRVTSWGYWLCYVPQDFKAARDRGAPNYASIRDLAFLSDESIAFSGQAATGLIQTPGAFFEYRRDGEKHGGSFAALQSPDQRALLFSSYLPGCEDARVAAGRQGRLLVASRSTGLMRHPSGDVPSPVLRAPQDRCRGPADGHLILIQAPGAAP